VAAAADAAADDLLVEFGDHRRDVEPDAVAPEDGEVRAVTDRDHGVARFLDLAVVDRAGRVARRRVGEAMGGVLDVDLVEVRAVRELLVFDVGKHGVELLLDVATGLLGERVDEFAVTVLVTVVADVEHVVDEVLARVVAEPVSGVVERLADVLEILLVVALLAGELEVVLHRLGLRAVRDAGDRRNVAELVGHVGVDHAREFDAHHARRDPVVLVVEVGVDVLGQQRLDRFRIGVVVIDDDDRDVVVAERLVSRGVLLGAAVVQHQEERKFLTVAFPVLQREIQIARGVFHLVERRLARQALEQMPFGVGVLVDLVDEPLERELDRDARAHPVAVGVVPDADRAPLEDRPAEQPRDRLEVAPELFEGGPLDERVDVARRGPFLDRGVEALGDCLGVLALENGQRVRLDLDSVLPALGVARDANVVIDVDVGARSDAGLLEDRAGDDTCLVTDVEQRRPAGLFDLDDLPLDVDRLTEDLGQRGDVAQVVVVGDGFDVVLVDRDLLERDVAVGSHLVEFDDELVADAVLAAEVGLVDESGDRIRKIDEHAVIDDAVDGAEVGNPLLDVVGRTVRIEIVDDGGRSPPVPVVRLVGSH